MYSFIYFLNLKKSFMEINDRVQIEERGNYYYIKIYDKFVGEEETDFLEKKLDSIVKSPKNKIIIDFAYVTYFSSIAIGILLKMDDKYTKFNGSIVLTNIPDVISNILEITKVSRILNITRNLEEAEDLIQRN